MEYLDARKNPIREGLYRDIRDKSYLLYLFQKESRWRCQTPDVSDSFLFPLSSSRQIVPIKDPLELIEHLKKAIGFIEKKIEEDIEERRRLM